MLLQNLNLVFNLLTLFVLSVAMIVFLSCGLFLLQLGVFFTNWIIFGLVVNDK